MADRVERFARSLPVPSLILDAGCGPGRDLARFAAHGHVPRGVDLNATFVALAQAPAPVTRADLRRIGSPHPPAPLHRTCPATPLAHPSATPKHPPVGPTCGPHRQPLRSPDPPHTP